MTNQKYNLPDALKKVGGFYESSAKGFLLKVNTHTYQFEKGQAVLNKNLYTFVLQGYKEIIHAEGKIVLQKNESAILKKGTYVVSERFENEGSFKNILIFFDDTFAQNILLNQQFDTNINRDFFQKVAENALLTTTLQTLESYTQQDFMGHHLEQLLRFKLSEIFVLMQSQNSSVSHFLQYISEEKQNKLLPIFEQHFKENLQLEDYAHLSNKSLSTLKRQFKQETGQSPFQWISERRLQEAKQQLVHQNLNISDIAYSLGFECLSHFSRVFKEKYGRSPTQYRTELLR